MLNFDHSAISSFSTYLKNTLKEIFNGHHNDANCKEYQERYERVHKKAPPPCKFKEHPELIPNLLQKVVIDSDGQAEELQSPFVSDQSDFERSDQTQDVQTVSNQIDERKPKQGLRAKLASLFKRK